MQIKYSPEADALVITLRKGKPVNSRDISEGVIVHYARSGWPLEIEILDASRVAQLDDVNVSWKEMLRPQESGV